MPDFDLYMLDHGFQPVADRCARWASCFRLARVCNVVGGFGNVATGALYLRTTDWPMPLLGVGLIIGGAVAVGLVGWTITVIETHAPRGRLNPARYTNRTPRLLWLALVLGQVAMATIRAHVTPDQMTLIIGFSGWLASVYFASCTPLPPPPPKPAVAPAGAVPQNA